MARIGIDLGGHTISAARVDIACTGSPVITIRTRRATPASRSLDDCAREMAEIAIELAGGDSVEAVGATIPGMIDRDRRHARKLPNFPPEWQDVDVVSVLERALASCGAAAPVMIENDANCWALGEGQAGAARGMSDYVVFTMGTGIGCGVVIGGRLVTGAHGMAGEGGHIVTGGGDLCGCGGIGHVETTAAADGTSRRAREAGLPEDFKELWRLRGTPEADAVLDPTIDAMARCAASVMHLLDPEAVIVGGGMSEGRGVVEEIASAANRYLSEPFRGRAAIVRAQLGADAALYGAASLASSTARPIGG